MEKTLYRHNSEHSTVKYSMVLAAPSEYLSSTNHYISDVCKNQFGSTTVQTNRNSKVTVSEMLSLADRRSSHWAGCRLKAHL